MLPGTECLTWQPTMVPGAFDELNPQNTFPLGEVKKYCPPACSKSRASTLTSSRFGAGGTAAVSAAVGVACAGVTTSGACATPSEPLPPSESEYPFADGAAAALVAGVGGVLAGSSEPQAVVARVVAVINAHMATMLRTCLIRSSSPVAAECITSDH